MICGVKGVIRKTKQTLSHINPAKECEANFTTIFRPSNKPNRKVRRKRHILCGSHQKMKTFHFPTDNALQGYCPTTLTYFRIISVVKHPEGDSWHRVNGISCVGWGCKRRQVVLQRFTKHAVERQVGPRDVPLLPVVLLHFLNLSPKAI